MYRQATGFDYVWDDRIFFIISTDLRQGDIVKAITEPVLSGTSYFRPLIMAWYVAEIRLMGVDPYWSHLTNIVIHLINTLLVGLISLRLQPDLASNVHRMRWVSLFAMLVYGLHPGLIESVAWVAGRFDAVVTMFSLLGILAALSNSRFSVAFAGISFFAAASSKEMAVTLPALIFLCRWGANHPTRSFSAMLATWIQPGKDRQLMISLIMAGLAYLFLRMHFLDRILHTDSQMREIFGTFWKHAGLVGLTLLFYFKTLAWPFTDSGPLHPYDPFNLSQAELSLGVVVDAVAVIFLLWTLYRPSRFRLILVAALISLAPVSNIIPLTIVGNIGHERFIVLPLSLLVLALSTIEVSKWSISVSMNRLLKPILWGGLFSWCLLCLVNLQVTVPLWKNQLTLWTWAYKKNPDYVYAQFLLASAAIESQRYDIAKEVLEQAEKQGPVPLRLSVPYGQYLIRIGKMDEGIAKIEKALENEFQPHIGILERGLSLESSRIPRQEFYGWLLVYAYTAMAEAHNSRRRFQKALDATDIALFYQQDNPPANLARSFALYGLGRWSDAERSFATTQRLIIPTAVQETVRLRKSFLGQLCTLPDAAPITCKNYGAEFASSGTASKLESRASAPGSFVSK